MISQHASELNKTNEPMYNDEMNNVIKNCPEQYEEVCTVEENGSILMLILGDILVWFMTGVMARARARSRTRTQSGTQADADIVLNSGTN